jgi:hypothetical protein
MSKFVLIETIKEKPEGSALGVFDRLDDALEFVENMLVNYGYEEKAYTLARKELKDTNVHKIDRGHYITICVAPINPNNTDTEAWS